MNYTKAISKYCILKTVKIYCERSNLNAEIFDKTFRHV